MKTGELFTTGGFGFKKYWEVVSASKGFATVRQLEWSRDIINESGVMFRTDEKIRRKIKQGSIYAKPYGWFKPNTDQITVRDRTQSK